MAGHVWTQHDGFSLAVQWEILCLWRSIVSDLLMMSKMRDTFILIRTEE